MTNEVKSIANMGVIVTHDSTFHADDVMAVAILQLTKDYNDSRNKIPEMERTRNPQALEGWKGVPHAALVDIGAEYDLDKLVFDPHQREGAGAREDGTKYAAAGLVWKHYGQIVVQNVMKSVELKNPVELSTKEAQEIAQNVDEEFIAWLDAHDNGQDRYEGLPNRGGPILSRVIYNMNPSRFERNATADDCFDAALSVCGTALLDAIYLAAERLQAVQEVRDAQRAHRGKVLVLERNCPWEDVDEIYESEILYVVFPDPAGNWRVQQVPEYKGSIKGKKPLPSTWAGLSREELVEETDVNDALFCHPNRFICGASSKMAALVMAAFAVEYSEEG